MSSNPLYRVIRDLPLNENAIHDIRLRFNSPGMHEIALSQFQIMDQHCDYTMNTRSKDILFPVWNIRDLLIKATVHRTDTVSIVIGCSLNPIALDVHGIIRLTNALSIVEERLSGRVEQSRIVQGFNAIKDIDSFHDWRKNGIVPPLSEWIVTMWHFGADALTEYSGE